MTVTVKYKKEDWEALATCIKTEQIPAADINAILNDNPDFAEWYKKEHMNDNN